MYVNDAKYTEMVANEKWENGWKRKIGTQIGTKIAYGSKKLHNPPPSEYTLYDTF